MTTAIAEYSTTEAALAELREMYGATVWDVSTPDRMAAAKKARADIRKWRLDLETERKRIKGPALARCKEIDTEAKRITVELLALETPVADAIKEVEQKAKREKEEKERLDAERVAKCRAEIDRIRNVPVNLTGESILMLDAAIASLAEQNLSALGEFEGVAISARDEAIEKLRAMHKAAEETEAEQARLAEERAELEALRAEQAARDQVEREKREAEERRRRAKIEAEEKEARERIAAEEALAREAREKADAEARELRAKQEAEARKAREAEEERLRAEREKIEAERREAEEYQRAMEAEEREMERQRTMRLDARGMLKSFVEKYGHLEEFASIVKAISAVLD
jgi:hypothetical protein